MKVNNFLYQLLFLLKNNALSSVLAYAVSILLARELGPESFGFYSYALVISSIATVLVNYSTDSTAVIFLSKYNQDKVQVFNLLYSLRLFLYFIYLVFLLFVTFYDPQLSLSLFFLSLPMLNLSFLFEINKENVRYSYFFMFERVLYCALILLLFFFEHLNLSLVFITLFLSSIFSLYLQFQYYIVNVTKFNFENVLSLKSVLKANLYLVLVALSTLSYGGFSRMIVEHKLGLFLLGIYSASWQLIKIGTLFQSQLDRVWRLDLATALLNKDIALFKQALIKYFAFGTVPISFGACFIYYFSDFITFYLYSNDYKGMEDIFGYISFYLVVINLDGLVRILWNAVGDRRFYFFINFIVSFTMLLAMAFYIESEEIVTYVRAVVFSHFLSVLALFYFFSRKKYL